MTRCAVRKGFFVLRNCDKMAANSCPVCGRAVCPEHMFFPPTGPVCVECNARRQEELDDNQYGSNWAYSYRHRYYSRTDYYPFYTGYYNDSYYDDYDVRAFDRKEGDYIDDGEEEGAGFLDS